MDTKQSAVISCDMTLFIRLLEVAREELKTDEQLHQLVERCSESQALKGDFLTMDDYETIMPPKTEKSLNASTRLVAQAKAEIEERLEALSAEIESYEDRGVSPPKDLVKERHDLQQKLQNPQLTAAPVFDREWVVVGLANAQKMEVGKIYRIGNHRAKVIEKTPPYSNHNERVKVEWVK